MITKKTMQILSVCLIVLGLSSCEMSTDNFTWSPDILAPIFHSSANVKDLSDLENKQMVFSLPALDIGFPTGINVNVPPLGINRLGPTSINISNYFEDVEIATADIAFTITNAFPIPIGAGSRIVVRSADDTLNSSIVFQYTIDQDVAPGNTYVTNSELSGQVIPRTMYVFIEDFQSPGGSNVVFSSNPSTFAIDISFLSIEKVRILTNQELLVEHDLQLSLTNSEPSDISVENAILHVFLENEIPVNVEFQFYFLDAFSSNPIDSLFTDGPITINAATTNDVTGQIMSSATINTDIEVNSNRLRRWEESTSARAVFDVNTNGNGTTVTASRELGVDVRMTGDLNIEWAINSNN